MFEKARDDRVNELSELYREIEKKRKTLLDMENEVNDLEIKKKVVSSELEKYKQENEKYAKILDDYKSMDIIKEYDDIKARYSYYESRNRELERKNGNLESDIELLKEEKEKLTYNNNRLNLEVSRKQGMKELENYFYTRGEEDLTNYFKSKGYDSKKARIEAQDVLTNHFSLEMVLALQDYTLTGKMDERALYGEFKDENKNEKGSDYYEKSVGRDKI